MAIRTEQAELLLSVRDDASRQTAQVERAIRGLGKTSQTSGKEAATLRDSIGTVGREALLAAGGALSLAAAIRGIGFAWQQAMAGIDDRRVEMRLRDIKGSTEAAAESMERLRAAAEGAMDDTSLARTAVLLDRIQIRTQEAQETVVAFARRYARDAGQPLQQVLTQMQEGLRTGEVSSLARYGISVDAKRAVEDYAKAEGIALAAITASQRTMVLRNAAIQEMGRELGYTTEELSKVEEAGTAWANTISAMQRAWADFLEPMAAARASGAGILDARSVVPLIDAGDLQAIEDLIWQQEKQIEDTIAARTRLMTQAARLREADAQRPARMGPGDTIAPTDVNAMQAQMLEQQASALEGSLDVLRGQLKSSRDEVRKIIDETAQMVDGWQKAGAPLAQLGELGTTSLSKISQQIESMRRLAEAAGWDGIVEDLEQIQTSARESIVAIIDVQIARRDVAQADLATFREWSNEAQKLLQTSATLNEADRQRLRSLQDQITFYGQLNAEGLKLAEGLDKLLDTGSTLELTRAQRELGEAFAEASKAAIDGTSELGAALVRTEEALQQQRVALENSGTSQQALNLLWEAGAAKLEYLRGALDDYKRALDAEALEPLTATFGVGLDPAELARAQEAARKAFEPKGGGAPRQGATEEMRVRAQEALGLYESEIDFIRELAQAQVKDLQDQNLTTEALMLRRVMIVSEGERRVRQIVEAEAAALEAARQAELARLRAEAQARLQTQRMIQDEQTTQLQMLGAALDGEVARRQIQRDLIDGLITAELAAEREKTLALREQYDQRAADLQRYQDATLSAIYAVNDASWQLSQIAPLSEGQQEIQRAASAMTVFASQVADASFEIARSSEAMAAADRQAAIERQTLTQMQQMDMGSESIAQQQQTIAALQQASTAAQATMGANLASTLQGVGGILAVFAGGAQEAAGVLAAFSAAAAVLALAFGAYPTAAQLGVAAGMFTAMAITAPKKKKASAPEIATRGLSAPTDRGGDLNVNITLTEGVIYGTPGQLGESIIRQLKAAQWGSERIPRALIG